MFPLSCIGKYSSALLSWKTKSNSHVVFSPSRGLLLSSSFASSSSSSSSSAAAVRAAVPTRRNAALVGSATKHRDGGGSGSGGGAVAVSGPSIPPLPLLQQAQREIKEAGSLQEALNERMIDAYAGEVAQQLRKTAKQYHPFFRPIEGVERLLFATEARALASDPLLTQISPARSAKFCVPLPNEHLPPFQRLLFKYFRKHRQYNDVAWRFLHLILERTEAEHLHAAFALPPGFNGRYYFFLLHLWLLHKRLCYGVTRNREVEKQRLQRLHDTRAALHKQLTRATAAAAAAVATSSSSSSSAAAAASVAMAPCPATTTTSAVAAASTAVAPPPSTTTTTTCSSIFFSSATSAAPIVPITPAPTTTAAAASPASAASPTTAPAAAGASAAASPSSTAASLFFPAPVATSCSSSSSSSSFSFFSLAASAATVVPIPTPTTTTTTTTTPVTAAGGAAAAAASPATAAASPPTAAAAVAASRAAGASSSSPTVAVPRAAGASSSSSPAAAAALGTIGAACRSPTASLLPAAVSASAVGRCATVLEDSECNAVAEAADADAAPAGGAVPVIIISEKKTDERHIVNTRTSPGLIAAFASASSVVARKPFLTAHDGCFACQATVRRDEQQHGGHVSHPTTAAVAGVASTMAATRQATLAPPDAEDVSSEAAADNTTPRTTPRTTTTTMVTRTKTTTKKSAHFKSPTDSSTTFTITTPTKITKSSMYLKEAGECPLRTSEREWEHKEGAGHDRSAATHSRYHGGGGEEEVRNVGQSLITGKGRPIYILAEEANNHHTAANVNMLVEKLQKKLRALETEDSFLIDKQHAIEGEMLDDALFNFTWDVVKDWLKQKKVQEARFEVELRNCQEHAYGFFAALDEALTDEQIYAARLKEALWGNVYSGRISYADKHLCLLAKYTLRQLTHLMHLPKEHFYRAYFTWADFYYSPDAPTPRVVPPLSQRVQYGGYTPEIAGAPLPLLSIGGRPLARQLPSSQTGGATTQGGLLQQLQRFLQDVLVIKSHKKQDKPV